MVGPARGSERVVLVVGASRGIGLVIAEHLAASGFSVIGTVRSGSAAEAVQALGVAPLVLDVTDHAAVHGLPDRVAELAPRGLHALVYNAGKSVAGPVELLDLDLAQQEVDVNYVGAAAVTKALLPALRANRGHIVYVTSVNGTAPVGLNRVLLGLQVRPGGFRRGPRHRTRWHRGTRVSDRARDLQHGHAAAGHRGAGGDARTGAGEPVPQLDETVEAIRTLKPNDPQVVAHAVRKVLQLTRPRFRIVAPRVPYTILTVGHRLLPLSGYRRLVALSTPKRRGERPVR